MPVIVDHADSRDHAPQLKTPIHPAELVERGANRVHADIEPDPYCNDRRGIVHVVHPRHVQSELPQILLRYPTVNRLYGRGSSVFGCSIRAVFCATKVGILT